MKLKYLSIMAIELMIATIIFSTNVQAQFQPTDVDWIGNDLNEAVNNALHDWETQYNKPENYLGRVNVNLNVANDELLFAMHNAIRAAVNGKTLGTYTFNTPSLIGIAPVLNNFGTNWKSPRRIQHFVNGCDNNVHNLDTATVFSCSHPVKSPIWQWYKYGIINANAAFDGESNVEMWLDTEDGEIMNFRDAAWFGIYAWWFMDAAAAWGHLVHMTRSTSQTLGFSASYVSYADGHVAGYMWTAKQNISVPIELVDFYALPKGNSNLLSWTTYSEFNNDYFELERSSNGHSDWGVIANVAGAGNSNRKVEYVHSDDTPLAGMNYYRLRQVDNDGTYRYSSILSVQANSKSFIHLSPNPTIDGLVAISGLPQMREDTYIIKIVDGTGRSMAIATPAQQINLSSYAPGLYTIQIIDSYGKVLAINTISKVE